MADVRRVVLIWPKFGPYHIARARAAVGIDAMEVAPVEVFRTSEYGSMFAVDEGRDQVGLVTLSLDAGCTSSMLKSSIHGLLSQLDPDLVFTSGWSTRESLITIDWCASNDTPIVIMSDTTREARPRHAAKEALKRRVVALSQAALVAGSPQAEYIESLSLPPERVFLGLDAVDNEHFRIAADEARRDGEALRGELGLPDRYFLLCARFIVEKNIPRLIEAYTKYRAKAGEEAWSLVIIGSGPLGNDIEALLVARSLIGSVHLLGEKYYPELPKYYGLAEVCILPSVSETWGLVVNEAMASGLPVLVSNRCGCARDLVEEGRSGFIFDPFDIEAMADSMLRIASDGCDRAGMGAVSREIIADWGPARFAAGFEAAARAALSAPLRMPSLVDRALLRALTIR